MILLSLIVIVSRMTEQIFKLTQVIVILEKRMRELEESQKTIERIKKNLIKRNRSMGKDTNYGKIMESI